MTVDIKAAATAVVRRVRENTIAQYDDEIAQLEERIAWLKQRRAIQARLLHNDGPVQQ